MTDNLPHEPEIEAAVLGSILLRPELIRQADFPSSAFYSPTHRAIYEAMLQLDEDGQPVDPRLLRALLRDAKPDIHVRLGALLDGGFTRSMHFPSYCDQIRKVAYRREVVKIEAAVREMAAERRMDANEIETERDKLVAMAREEYWPVDRSMDPLHAEDRLRDFYQRIEEWSVTTGYDALDLAVGDLYPGMVVTILARPGIGKSLLALNMVARWLARPSEWGVMFASLEMGDTLATDRLIRIVEGWDKATMTNAMRSGRPPVLYRERTAKRYSLYVAKGSSLAQIEAAMLDWQRSHGAPVRVLVIDYFQYLKGERGESLYEKGSRLSRELKEMAKGNDLVIFNLCQVKRGEEGGKGYDCPTLEAARDSGTIEENADVVLGMWRPKQPEQTVSLRGLKVRQGEAGKRCDLFYDVDTGRLQ